MVRTSPIRLAAILTLCSIAGCSGGSSSEPSTSTASTAAAATAPSVSTDAIARAASDFLDAVLAGDIQRASARLTPQAMQRIIGSGLQFQPGGQEKAAFHTSEVRMPTKTQALVQFVFTYTDSADGQPKSEEGCCLMRLVEGEWRVSGLAYGTGSNQRWTLDDFETGQRIPIARQPVAQNAAKQPPSNASGRPSPLRTAQESAPAVH